MASASEKKAEKRPEKQAGARPVKSFLLRGVSVSVFENHAQGDGKDVVYYKTSLQKTYKEGDEFKTTTSLGRDDLPVARLLLGRAWEYILDRESEQKSESSS